MEHFTLLVTPALMTGLIQIGKMTGLIPKGWEKVAAFTLGLIFAGLFFWNKDWLEMVIAVLGFASSSVGIYEMGVKPVKKMLE